MSAAPDDVYERELNWLQWFYDLDLLSREELAFLQSKLEYDNNGGVDLVISGFSSRRWLSLAIRAGMGPNAKVLSDGNASYDRLALALMSGDFDQISHLFFKYGRNRIDSTIRPKCESESPCSNFFFWRNSCMRYARDFKSLRFLWRFLKRADSRIARQKFSYCAMLLRKHQCAIDDLPRRCGKSKEALDRELELTPYDGIARTCLKEVALGLAPLDLPVLLVIEIGGWFAAAHDDLQDDVVLASAWQMAKAVKAHK